MATLVRPAGPSPGSSGDRALAGEHGRHPGYGRAREVGQALVVGNREAGPPGRLARDPPEEGIGGPQGNRRGGARLDAGKGWVIGIGSDARAGGGLAGPEAPTAD